MVKHDPRPIGRLDASLFKLLRRQFREFYPYYLGAFLALILTHYVQAMVPYYAKELGDLAGANGVQINISKFFFLAIAIVVFRTSSRLLFFYPARILQKWLKTEMIQKIEQVHPARYKDYSPGQLYQIIHNDLNQMRGLIGFGLLQIGNVFIASAVLFPRLIAFNSHLVIALSPLFIGVIIFSLLTILFVPLRKKSLVLQGEVQNFLIESYSGKKSIQNYHVEKSFIELFKEASLKELNVFYKGSVGVAFSIPLVRLGFGISLLWGAYIVRDLNLGASSLILFSGFLFLFLEPFMFVSWIGVIFAQSVSAWQRVQELLSVINQKSESEQIIAKLNSTNSSELNFRLPFWEKTIDLSPLENKWTVIVGATGCGKSTLLLNFAQACNVKNINFSFVAQEPYLYNDTIEHNIFLDTPVTETNRRQAVQLLDLFELNIDRYSPRELLDIEVGENGKRLSGGQAKRVCLIRSLLSNRRFLIWDDPFSAVDVLLEKKILSQLKQSEHMINKTLILSAHRLSTVRFCDDVIYLNEHIGIMESGNVTEKINNKESKISEYFQKQLI